MRFLLDMNLPPSMADWLRSEGHDAVHARESGAARSPDRDLFSRAAEEQRIVITFDLEVGEIVALSGTAGAGVMLLRLRRARQPYLRDRVGVAITEVGDALEAGAIVLVEDARIRVRPIPPR